MFCLLHRCDGSNSIAGLDLFFFFGLQQLPAFPIPAVWLSHTREDSSLMGVSGLKVLPCMKCAGTDVDITGAVTGVISPAAISWSTKNFWLATEAYLQFTH